MERFTQPGFDPCTNCGERSHCEHITNPDFTILCGQAEMYKRLSAYEDTGLEPQEINRIVDEYGRGNTLRTHAAERLELIREIPTDRLRELVEADRDGRVAIRPCKIGDTVYEIRYSFEENKARKYGRKKRDFSVSTCTWKMKASPENCYVTEKKCTKSDFTRMGKTVFLTREAAEAALKGEHDA